MLHNVNYNNDAGIACECVQFSPLFKWGFKNLEIINMYNAFENVSVSNLEI